MEGIYIDHMYQHFLSARSHKNRTFYGGELDFTPSADLGGFVWSDCPLMLLILEKNLHIYQKWFTIEKF